jgi:diguanylate cyclase (GGDEF)-like protein
MPAKAPRAGSKTAMLGLAQGRVPLDPRKVLTAIGEAVYDWDLASDEISWGANAAEVLGVPDLAVIATGAAFALRTETGAGRTRHEAVLRSDGSDGREGVPYRADYFFRPKNAAVVWVEDTGRWYAGPDGQAARAHGVVRLRAAESRHVAGEARERASFLETIAADVAEAGRAKRSLTILVFALDELGRLNDDLGFEAADGIIGEVARRIQTIMRRRDAFVRYAGNRFALVLRSCPLDQAESAAQRVRQAIESPPLATALGPLLIGTRIGAATAPDHALDAATLLRRAEEALSSAKRALGRSFVLYDGAQLRHIGRRAAASPAYETIEALNSRRIIFVAQPVVDAQTRAVAFREALMRIRTERGVVKAGAILPAIERTGLVPLVDARMLELVADHLANHPDERLAVNLSPTTLEKADWLDTFAAHLGARPGIASRFIVELTETAVVRDPQGMRARLDAMKALGVAVAIDDFGAGHTSFRHLRHFPVDLLKIDGAFVQNLARSPDDRFFVRALVDLAHHLGIATVAEWVEDEETARLLTEWGVDYLQGQHCGAPVLVSGKGAQEPRDAA